MVGYVRLMSGPATIRGNVSVLVALAADAFLWLTFGAVFGSADGFLTALSELSSASGTDLVSAQGLWVAAEVLSSFLFGFGCAELAVAKGRSRGWGLFFVLGVIGVVILWLLPRRFGNSGPSIAPSLLLGVISGGLSALFLLAASMANPADIARAQRQATSWANGLQSARRTRPEPRREGARREKRPTSQPRDAGTPADAGVANPLPVFVPWEEQQRLDRERRTDLPQLIPGAEPPAEGTPETAPH